MLVILPIVVLGLAWVLLGWISAQTGLVPALHHWRHLVQQAVVVGLAATLVWRWLLTLVLALYFLNSYIFFGASPFWDFIQQTGVHLIRPLAWTRLGRINFPPLLVLALVCSPALVARAEEPVDKVSAARGAFERGAAFASEERWGDALAAFSESASLRPHATT